MKKLLIALMICGLLAGNVSGGFIAPRKANAQGAPAPARDSLAYSFTSTANTEIKAELSGGNVVAPFTFGNRNNSLSYNDLNVTGNSRPASMSNESTIIGFDLTSPSNQTCRAITVNVPVVLIIYRNQPGKFKVAGLYMKTGGGGAIYYSIIRTSQTGNGECKDLPYNTKVLIDTTNSAEYIDALFVGWTINNNDKDAICVEMGVKWEAMKDASRNLYVVDLKNSEFWKNIGMSLATATFERWKIEGWIGFTQYFDMLKPLGIAKQEDLNAGEYDAYDHYVLTDSGKQILAGIIENAKRIKEIITILENSGDNNQWPCDNKLVKFKRDKNQERTNPQYFSSLDEFKIAIDKMLVENEKIQDILSSSNSTADESGTCGKMGFSFDRKMWYVLLCNIADLSHLVAGSLMTRATEYLEASIGIEAVKFQKPKPVSESGGNAPTGTPTTGTPAAGTPAAGTPQASAPTTGQTYHATATTCTPLPCFDKSWKWHGPSPASETYKAQVLCKVQKDNPGISRDSWNAGTCLANPGFRIGIFTVNVMSKSDHAATPKKHPDYCQLGGNWISMFPDCSGWITN